MSRSRTALVLAAFSSLVLCGAARAASGPPRFSGMVYADALVALQGNSVPADSSSFRFRRVQFTYDQDVDSVFSLRFQIEADDANLSSGGRSAPYLKQAFLRWSHLGVAGDLFMGLSPTPTWRTVEEHWGYRSLEKTLLDLRGAGVPTDLGVGLFRAVPAGGGFGHHLMVANGSGQKPEQNASKKFSLALPVRLGAWQAEALGEFEGESGPRDRYTTRLFAGWLRGDVAVGAEVAQLVLGAAGPQGSDQRPFGASAWARGPLGPRWRFVGRVDWTDPDRAHEQTGYTEVYALASLDYMPLPNVHVMPNYAVRTYSAKDAASPDKDADQMVRVTLWYNWR